MAASVAIRRLHEAFAGGFHNLVQLRRETDLDSLRSRLDFRLPMMAGALPAAAFAR